MPKIFLVAFLTLFFFACGGGGDGGGEGAAGGGTPTTAGTTQVANSVNPPAATQPAADPVPDPAPDPAPEPAPDPVPVDPVDQQLRAAMAQAGVEPLAAPPAQDPNLVALGEALMFDKILSGNKDISCATCHHPTLASDDDLSLSIGTGGTGLGANRQLGAGRNFIPRNAPALFNLAEVERMFWDGRVNGNLATGLNTPAGNVLPAGLNHALAAQAMFPVTSADEMRGVPGDMALDGSANELAGFAADDFTNIWASLMARLLALPEYATLFQAAFPGVSQNQLGFQHAANAIAAFEIDRFSQMGSPFDQYLAGNDGALNEAQKRGALLFYGRARCAVCHRGPLLSDLQFHNIAAPQVGPGVGAAAPLDLGRGAQTGNAQDNFRFRTPILRNVALTGPWMHAGAYTSLNAVVGHYRNPANSLRNYNPNQLDPRFRGQVRTAEQLAAGVLNNLDPQLAPVQLNGNDVDDLVAFLESLTDPTAAAVTAPATVPSGFPVD